MKEIRGGITMKRKLWLIILAVLCLLAGIVFGVVGFMGSQTADTFQDLKFLGRRTFEAYAATQEEDGTYTIYYQTIGDESGAISYARYDVGKEEYDSYQFDVAVANSDLDAEQIPKSVITRYVYTYWKDGELCNAIYDNYKTVDEVADQIGRANHVAPLRFYAFAVILFLCGTYIMILACTKRKPIDQTKHTKTAA